MALSTIVNTFAGNPLDRASERRVDAAWLKNRLDDPETLAVALWNGKPLVEDAPGGEKAVRIAYLSVPMAREIAAS